MLSTHVILMILRWKELLLFCMDSFPQDFTYKLLCLALVLWVLVWVSCICICELIPFTLCNAAVPTVGSLQPFFNKTVSEILTLFKGCTMAQVVSILRQSTWNMWWAKCQWDGFSTIYFDFYHISIMTRRVHINIRIHYLIN
jgi:hypothetical protein